jgi:hypothetical protein
VSQTAHEQFVAYRTVAPPSDRKFGLTVGLVLIALSAVRYLLGHAGIATAAMACIGAGLVAAALIAPRMLRPLNRGWMGIGELLGRVTNFLIMLVLFALIFTPVALCMRLFGRDALGLKPRPTGNSYWHKRDDQSDSGGLFNQF